MVVATTKLSITIVNRLTLIQEYSKIG